MVALTREDMMAEIGKQASQPVGKFAEGTTAEDYGIQVGKPYEPPQEPLGFLGPLGKFIMAVDTPRAMIASTAQETIDLFQGEGFSLRDWKDQVDDNYMFGEILMEEGWGTGTAWDIAIGLPLDIFFDPITHMLGPLGAAGTAAKIGMGATRVASKMSAVAKTASRAAAAADKVGDAALAAREVAKATKYREAAVAVTKNNAISAAPKEILEEMGFKVAGGLAFSTPGTGRVGRKLLERPLDRILGGLLSKTLDPKRIKQIPKFMIDDVTFDLWGTSLKAQRNRNLVEEAMSLLKQGRNIDRLATGQTLKNIRQAAKIANGMAVNTGIYIPGTYGLATKLAMGPGRLWGTMMVRSTFMEDIHKAFASADKGAVKRMMRGTGLRGRNLTDEDRLVGLEMWDGLQTAMTAEKTFGVQFAERLGGLRNVLDELNESLRATGAPEITVEDMMRIGQADNAWHMTPEGRRINNLDGDVSDEVLEALDDPQQLEELLKQKGKIPSRWEAQIQIKKFWEGVRKDYNAALASDGQPGFGSVDEMLDDFYVARFLDMETDAAQKVVNKGHWKPPSDAQIKPGMSGSPTQERIYKPGESFLGRLLVSPEAHPQGLSIVDQMRVIGKEMIGPEFVSLYSEDFWYVAERWGKVMGSRARHQRWINELEKAGIVQRGTVTAEEGLRLTYDVDVVKELAALVKSIKKEQGKFQTGVLNSDKEIEGARRAAVKALGEQDEIQQQVGEVLVRLNNELTNIQTVLNEFEDIAGAVGFSPKAKQYLLDLLDGKMATKTSKQAALDAEILEEIVEFIEPLAQRLALIRKGKTQLQETMQMAAREGIESSATPAKVAFDDMLRVPTKERGYLNDLQIFLNKLEGEITDLEKFMRYITGNLHTSAMADESVEMMETLVKLTDDISDPRYPLVITSRSTAETVRPKRALSPERQRQLRQPRGVDEPELVQRREGGKFVGGKEIKPRAAYEFAETIEAPGFEKITIHQFADMDLPQEMIVEQVFNPQLPDGGAVIWQVEHTGRTFKTRTAAMDHIYEELGYVKVPRVFRNEKGQIVSKTSVKDGSWVRSVRVPKDSPIRKTKEGAKWADLFERMGNLSNELNAAEILTTTELDDIVGRVANMRASLDGSPAMLQLNEDLARLEGYISSVQGTRVWFVQLAERGKVIDWPSPAARPKKAQGKSDYWLGMQRGYSDETIARRYQTRSQPQVKGGPAVAARTAGDAPEGEKAIRRFVTGVREGDLNDAHRQFSNDRLAYYADEGIEPPDVYAGARQEYEDLLKVKNQIDEQIRVQHNLIDNAVQKAAAKRAALEDLLRPSVAGKGMDPSIPGASADFGMHGPADYSVANRAIAAEELLTPAGAGKAGEADRFAAQAADELIEMGPTPSRGQTSQYIYEEGVPRKSRRVKGERQSEDLALDFHIWKAEADARQLQLQAEITRLRESDSIVDFFRSAPDPDEAILRVLTDRGLYGQALDSYGEAQSNFLRSYRNIQQKLTPGKSQYVVGGLSDVGFELFEEALAAGAKMFDYTEVKGFLQGYRKFANWWKSQAVTTPGFILRNMMGGMWINSMIAGVEFGTHSKVIGMTKVAAQWGDGNVLAGMRQLAAHEGPVELVGVAGLGGLRKASNDDFKMMLELMESGSVGSGQSWSEVATSTKTAMRPYERATRKGRLGEDKVVSRSGITQGFQEGTWKPWSADFKFSRAIRTQNERAEFTLRATVGFDTLAKGGDVARAQQLITKYHFDYGDITNVERRIKDVIPFYTWQKNVIPVLFESMGRKPESWGRLLQVKRELELHSPRQGLVPDYYGENMGIRMPFKIPGIRGGRVYALPDLPFRDFQRYLKEPTSPIRGPLESAFPWVKLPAEIWAKKQTFADIPFSGRYQQVPTWGKIPGLMPLLAGMGKAKQAKDGTWRMRDNDIYAVDQFVPFFGRMRRLIPNEQAKQRRLMTTWVSTVFGGGFRVNDPWEKKSQFIKDQKKFADEMRDILDIETRSI